jgi:hypothetical protein
MGAEFETPGTREYMRYITNPENRLPTHTFASSSRCVVDFG